jgi:PEP-CTERM motif
MKHAVQSVIAVCVLAGAPPAATQIINGGFEEGAFGDGSVRQILPGEEALKGWTVNDNPVAWYTNGYEPPNALKPIAVAPHTGNLAINLCDGSVAKQCDDSVRPVSMSQTFTVLPFIEQQVSFWVGNLGANGGPVSIGVTIEDGTSNTLPLSETARAPATDLDSTWQQSTYSFIPDGRSNAIRFSEIGGDAYAGLDDITVMAVPEPSTWALALLGFADLAIVGMRRAARPQVMLSSGAANRQTAPEAA